MYCIQGCDVPRGYGHYSGMIKSMKQDFIYYSVSCFRDYVIITLNMSENNPCWTRVNDDARNKFIMGALTSNKH